MPVNDLESHSTVKLASLIHDIQIAMLTTVEEDGTLRSRPMATQKEEFKGQLWFFTGASSGKVFEIDREHRVNLSYADPSHNRYVSVSGTGQIVRDKQRAEELWNPMLKAWFPKGVDDPDLALLRVDVESAEYWDAPSSTMVQVAGFIKAVVTGRRMEHPGDHGTIRMS